MIRGESIAERWKVLVYDGHCADIVAPTLRVGELRACNVTLWMRLEQERQAIPDAPAVYFVSPSADNVKRVARDIQLGLYCEHHINFCGALPERQLEELALACVEAGRVASVQSLHSRHLDFVALEADLFSLNIADSYVLFNDEAIEEAAAARFIEQMVEGLLGVVSTLGRVPVIRCNAASHVSKMVAQALNTRIAGAVERGELSDSGSSGRLLLVVDDRNTDVAAIAHHCPNYQSLVHDCLPFALNRVTLPASTDKDGKAVPAVHYDLESASDPFWRQNRELNWAEIGPAVKRAMESWQRENEQVLALQVKGSESQEQLLNKAEGLTVAVGRMGQVTEAKRVLDMHTNISKSVAQQLTERGYVHLWKAEMEMMRGRAADVAALLEGSSATREDKLRLLLVGVVTGMASVPPAFAGEPALEFVVRRHSTQSSKAAAAEADESIVSRGWTSLLSGSSRVASMLSKYGHGDSELLKLSAIMSVLQSNGSPAHADEDDPIRSYLYLDPKQGAGAVQRKSQPFDESILFVVGGGNYTEYQNVVAQGRAQGRRVIYGSTEMLAPNQFLAQLNKLAVKKK